MRQHRSKIGPLWAAAFAILVACISRDVSRLSAAFGPSHDGFNAALYMTGGRAILEDGLWNSRFGAIASTVSGERIVYAHHPPLAFLGDAAIAAALGTSELASRLLAVLCSSTALLQLTYVLGEVGLASGPAAIGLLVAFATPMYFLFGATTEPHILGLAPMVSVVLLWTALRRGSKIPPTVLMGASIVAALTSWLAGLFVAVVAGTLFFFERRRTEALTLLTGIALSGTLVVAWIVWAYDGSLADFSSRAMLRLGMSPESPVTLRQVIYRQMIYLDDLFPLEGWWVVPIATFGLLDVRTRSIVATSLGTVLGYAALFRNGAYDHNYWLYCILLPLAIGAAIAAERGARWLSAAVPDRLSRLTPSVAGGALVVLVVIAFCLPSDEQRQRVHAARIGAQARELQWPPDQQYAYHAFGLRGRTDLLPWLAFYSRRVPLGVTGPGDVPRGEFLLTFVNGRLSVTTGAQADAP